MPVYTLRADQCPAIAAAAAVLDPAGGYPLVASRFALGMDPSFAVPIMQEIAVRTDLAGRHGGGAPGIVFGLEITAGTGLEALVGAGQAMIDGAVTLGAEEGVALTDNARNHLWLTQSADLLALTGLAAPEGVNAYLGSAVAAAGVVTAVDYSCRLLLHGLLYRKTADVAAPLDTPPANVYLYTETTGGLYLWMGGRHWLVATP